VVGPDTLPETQTLPMSRLFRNDELQVRVKLCDDTVYKYYLVLRSNPNAFPPLKVARCEGKLMLYDGYHRFAAMERAGIDKVQVEITDVSDRRQVYWMAAQANLTHGLPLSTKDHRNAFAAYMIAGKSTKVHKKTGEEVTKSYREIAKEIGGVVSYATVRNWMKEDFPQEYYHRSGYDEDLYANSVRGGLMEAESFDYYLMAQNAISQAASSIPQVDDVNKRARLLMQLDKLTEQIREQGHKEIDFDSLM